MSDLARSVGTIVLHTPSWVWVLYPGLLFVGAQRTRDSILPLWRLLILPLAVALLTLTGALSAGVAGVPAVLLGLVVGSSIGWRLEPEAASRRVPGGRIAVRGEWWTLGQISLVLIFRYATSVAAAMNPVLKADVTWQSATLLASTGLSAVLFGRVAARVWAYHSRRAVDLVR